MRATDIFDVLGAIVTVAMVTTIVSHPNSAAVIKSSGEAFSSSIKAAIGS